MTAKSKKSGPDIEFSIKVTEDNEVKFESSLNTPLFQEPEKQKEVTEAWLQLMESGLKFARLAKPDDTD